MGTDLHEDYQENEEHRSSIPCLILTIRVFGDENAFQYQAYTDAPVSNHWKMVLLSVESLHRPEACPGLGLLTETGTSADFINHKATDEVGNGVNRAPDTTQYTDHHGREAEVGVNKGLVSWHPS